MPVDHAELCFTRSRGGWCDRYWETMPARWEAGSVSAVLPPGTVAYYFNVYDVRQLAVSSEMDVLG